MAKHPEIKKVIGHKNTCSYNISENDSKMAADGKNKTHTQNQKLTS